MIKFSSHSFNPDAHSLQKVAFKKEHSTQPQKLI